MTTRVGIAAAAGDVANQSIQIGFGSKDLSHFDLGEVGEAGLIGSVAGGLSALGSAAAAANGGGVAAQALAQAGAAAATYVVNSSIHEAFHPGEALASFNGWSLLTATAGAGATPVLGGFFSRLAQEALNPKTGWVWHPNARAWDAFYQELVMGVGQVVIQDAFGAPRHDSPKPAQGSQPRPPAVLSGARLKYELQSVFDPSDEQTDTGVSVVVDGVTYHRVWDATNQVWSLVDDAGRFPEYTTIVEGSRDPDASGNGPSQQSVTYVDNLEQGDEAFAWYMINHQINAVSQDEYERQLKFQIKSGNEVRGLPDVSDFSETSWTYQERQEYDALSEETQAQIPQSEWKFKNYAQHKYEEYWESKVVELKASQRRIEASSAAGDAIAIGALVAIGGGTLFADSYIAYGAAATARAFATNLVKGYVGSKIAGALTSSGGPDGGFGSVASVGGALVSGGLGSQGSSGAVKRVVERSIQQIKSRARDALASTMIVVNEVNVVPTIAASSNPIAIVENGAGFYSAPAPVVGAPAPFVQAPAPFVQAPVTAQVVPASVVRIESTGAWSFARPGSAAQAAIAEAVRMGFLNPALVLQGANAATATSQTPWSQTTAIRAQTAEVSAYDMRLARGEIGILAPSGSNVVGPDYATAVRLPNGEFEIIVGDAKSRVSDTSAFGRVSAQLPPKWGQAIDAAIGRVGLPNPDDVRAIQRAWAQGRYRTARDTIDFSLTAQGPRIQLDN